MELSKQLLPVYEQMLGTLEGLLAKAAEREEGESLLTARLAKDMHPLATQIRFLCNMPSEALSRLTGQGFVSSDEDVGTFAEARERIATTRARVEQAAQVDFPSEDARIELALPNGMTFDLSASGYVRDWALPQFYFHLVTAYAILRSRGVPLGKADYVPYMFKYLRGGQS